MTLPSDFGSPLPAAYLLDGPGVGGRLKLAPEDFIVHEIPSYEPSGAGEHLYLLVRKAGCSHGEAVRAIARATRCSERAIGFAGMKDKVAVTTQWFSVHTPHDAPAELKVAEGVEIIDASRHGNKLRRGHLRGNEFTIKLREVDPVYAPRVLRMLRLLASRGVPDYFGAQRFGYRANNHLLGWALLQRDWQALLDELLGSRGSAFPDHQRERREQYDAGHYREAISAWGRRDRQERLALGQLAAGHSPERACRALGDRMLEFWVNAAQSAIFNRLLDQRIENGLLDRLRAGDLAWKHDSRAVFRVESTDLNTPEIVGRLQRLEVSPSGPLWGADMMRAEGDTAVEEQAALARFGLTPDDFDSSRVRGARRAMRVPIFNPRAEGGFDDRGPYIEVAFALPRGAYATVVLREIMRNDLYDADESDDHAGDR